MQVERQKKLKPTLFLTKSCWSPKYTVSVLSTCGGSHPEGFIVASFRNLKHIANNNNKNNNSNNNNQNNNDHKNKLSSYKNFRLYNF